MKNKFFSSFLKFSVVSVLTFVVAFNFVGATTLRELTNVFIDKEVIPSNKVPLAWEIVDDLENPSQNTPACGPFTSDQTIGSTGSEVSQLQKFLIERGFLSLPPDVGIGYFGSLTKSALASYQNSVVRGNSNLKIERDGYFGSSTRLHLASICSGVKNAVENQDINVKFVNSSVSSSDKDDDGNDTGTFQIIFDVTAVGGDVYVPTSSQVASSTIPVLGRDEIQYIIKQSGEAVSEDLSDLVDGKAIESNESFRIREGNTERLYLTVTKANDELNDGGIYQMFMIGIPWDTKKTSNYRNMKALNGFSTDSVFLKGSDDNDKSKDNTSRSKTSSSETVSTGENKISVSRDGSKIIRGITYDKFVVELEASDESGGSWSIGARDCTTNTSVFFEVEPNYGFYCSTGFNNANNAPYFEAGSDGSAKSEFYIRSFTDKRSRAVIEAKRIDGSGVDRGVVDTEVIYFSADGVTAKKSGNGFVANIFNGVGSALKKIFFGN